MAPEYHNINTVIKKIKNKSEIVQLIDSERDVCISCDTYRVWVSSNEFKKLYLHSLFHFVGTAGAFSKGKF